MGDPYRNCLNAVGRIGELIDCIVMDISKFYLTEPFGVEDQNWYVNGVVSVSTDIPCIELMERLLDIEADMGRVRSGGRWEPRVIDLDILLYGKEIIDEDNLKVPHPLMHERKFVMTPMVDLAPDLEHPSLGKTMMELLQVISDEGQRIKEI